MRRRGPASARAHDLHEVVEHAQPVARGLLGVELDAEHRAVRRRSWRSARRTRSCRRRRRVARPRRERVHVVERRSRLAAGPRSAARRARTGPRSSRCAGRAARRSAGASPSPADQPEPARAPELLGVVEQQLHAEADPEQRQALGRAARGSARRGRARRGCASPAGRRPRPAARAPSAARSSSWSPVIDGARADVLERLLDRAAVAHPVVDHGSRPRVTRASPWCSARRARRVERDRRAQRPGQRLERPPRSRGGRSCRARPSTCRVSLAFMARARKNSSTSSWSKLPIAPGGSAASNAQQPASGDVDRARRARLVHRHRRRP